MTGTAFAAAATLAVATALQTGGAQSPELAFVAFASTLLTLVLGLAISAIALRGYRRNDSRPLLWFAAGFLLLTVVPILLAFVPVGDGPVRGVVGEVSRLVGLVAILYGLRMPIVRRASGPAE